MNYPFLSGIIRLFLPAILMLICIETPLHADNTNDIVVVVNKKFPSSRLSVTDVRRIFRKEITTWKGTSVKPIHALAGSKLRQLFTGKALGVTEAADQKYWQDMKLKKGMRAPMELSNNVRAVFSIPGAITYCYRKDFNPATASIVLVL